MVFFLELVTFIGWVITYVELARLGFRDKTYGMPIFPLALNVIWEILYSYIILKSDPTDAMGLAISIWFLLDIIIVYTYLRYGRKYFPKQINQKYFLIWTKIIFLMAIGIQYAFFIKFDSVAIWYSAFISNLIMSVAFINMLYIRKDTKGQNLTIAISKWIGTLAPTIIFGVIYGNQLGLSLGIFCSVFDIIYIYYLKVTMNSSVSQSKSSRISSSNFTDIFKG